MEAGRVQFQQLHDRVQCQSQLKTGPQAQMALLVQCSLQARGRGFAVTDWAPAGLEVFAVS